ncbi:CoA transferase [Pseudomonas sp. NPDC007930]|uniref:CaiB/BaiF CoA transferase family protein n=1 Tax=Pseudomonas sp. NPDC007930 TaxID=3364417 RepID=UPI0036E8CC99
MSGLPLSGIRVVDYSHFLAGPYMARCLAALGADVIKVERPGGGDPGRVHAYMAGDVSGYFLQQNMGKRGICVDVRQPEGLKIVEDLVRGADVFLENYRPGALEKLGLGYEALAAINPGLIYCSVSAYGHTGPDAGQPGFGLIAEAKSGALAQMGNPGEAPPLLRMPIADMYTGIHGVAAICAAIVGRHTGAGGQHIDLALYDCMVSMHDFAIQAYTISGGEEIPRQVGHDLPDATVYGVFAACDGYLVIAAQVDAIWQKLARLIGGDALAADERFLSSARRNANRPEALGYVTAWAAAQAGVKHCIGQLTEAGVPCAPVQRIDEVVNDPQVAARNMIIEQQHPELGTLRLPNLPFRFSGFSAPLPKLAPSLGEDNSEVLEELGYSQEQIASLARAGVLSTA